MTLEETRQFWQDKATEYIKKQQEKVNANSGYFPETKIKYCQWMEDALWVAYLTAVEQALKIRIIN